MERWAKMEETKNKELKELVFTKESLLQSIKYADRKDLLNALLEENKEYTIKEVDSIIENFQRKGVH